MQFSPSITNNICYYPIFMNMSGINPFIQSLFSSVFFFQKKMPIVVVRNVCPFVRLSVRLSSVKIFFCGNLITNRSIDLKIGLNVR